MTIRPPRAKGRSIRSVAVGALDLLRPGPQLKAGDNCRSDDGPRREGSGGLIQLWDEHGVNAVPHLRAFALRRAG